MTIQALLQAFLVQGMPDEPYAPSQHKEPVEVANLDDVLDLSLQRQYPDSWLLPI